MEESTHDRNRRLLEAASFAARAHEGQFRNDGVTPYASHPTRVCLIVRQLFGVDDPQALVAALLHDTVEDTKTDFDDLAKAFGDDVAAWVGSLSKDKRLPEADRETAYIDGLRAAPWQVRVCKLADVYDNLTDARKSDAKKRTKTLKNARRYLDALRSDEPRIAKAWGLASDLLREVEAQDAGGAGGD